MPKEREYHDPEQCEDCKNITVKQCLSIIGNIVEDNRDSLIQIKWWCVGITISLALLFAKYAWMVSDD